jgi:hypothetical protein
MLLFKIQKEKRVASIYQHGLSERSVDPLLDNTFT